jgi:hypothetical protein
MRIIKKGFGTLITSVRSLPSVSSHVITQLTPFLKCLGALVAFIWSFFTVNKPHMLQQATIVKEGLGTLRAFELWFFAIVNSHVDI